MVHFQALSRVDWSRSALAELRIPGVILNLFLRSLFKNPCNISTLVTTQSGRQDIFFLKMEVDLLPFCSLSTAPQACRRLAKAANLLCQPI